MTDYLPQGDTAVGGNDFAAPKKKKKKAPAVSTSGAQQLAAHEAAAPSLTQKQAGAQYTREIVHDQARANARDIRQQERSWLYANTLYNKPERGQVLDSISQRASALNPRLLAAAPHLAAELLMGETKTRDLNSTSTAAYHGWVEQQRQAHFEQNRMVYAANPEAWRLQQAIAAEPILTEAVKNSEGIRNEQMRAYYLNQVDETAQMQPGVGRDYALKGLQNMYDDIQSGDFTIPQDGGTEGLGEFTHMAGQAFNIIPYTVSKATDLLGAGLEAAGQNDAAGFLNEVQAGVGGAAHLAGQSIQVVQRNLQGAAVLAGEAPSAAYHGVFGGQPEGGFLTSDELWTTWDEAGSGEHSPFSIVVARMYETDVSDPKIQSLVAFTDMTVDLVGQVALFKGLSAFKTSIRATQAGGGVSSGEAMVNSPLLGGPRLVDAMLDDTKGVASRGGRATILENNFKGVTPTMAWDLAETTTRDQLARRLADHIDDVPDVEVPKAQARLDSVNESLADKSTAPPPTLTTEAAAAVEVDQFGALAKQAAEGGARNTDMAALTEDIRTNGVTNPIEIRVNEDGSFSRMSGTHRLEAAQAAGITDVPVKWVDENGNVIANTSPSPLEIEALKAEKAALEQRIWDLTNREPVFEFPRISHLRPLMRGTGTGLFTGSAIGRAVGAVFGEAGKFDLSRAFNEIQGDGKLIDPAMRDRPEGWASSNFDVLRKTMDVLKVDKATQRQVLAHMFDVAEGRLSVFEWRNMITDAYRTGKRYTPEMEAEIRLSTKSVEDRTFSYAERSAIDSATGDKLSQTKPIAVDQYGNPRIIRPTQGLNGIINLPRMRYLEEASSWVTRLDSWMKDKPYLAKKGFTALRTGGAAARFVTFVLPRLLFRSTLLVLRPGRLAGKFEVDQGVRGFLAEGMTPLDYWNAALRRAGRKVAATVVPDGWHDYEVGGIPTTESKLPTIVRDKKVVTDWGPTGNIMSEQMSDTMFHREKMSTAGLDFELNPKEVHLVAEGVYERLESLAADELTQRIALHGPEATVRWLEANPDSALVDRINREVMPGLADSGLNTFEDVVRFNETEIQQATGNNLDYREAIGTGHLPTTEPVPASAAIEQGFVRAELVEARDSLATAQDAATRENLNLRIEDLEARSEALTAKAQTRGHVRLNDETGITDRIKADWEGGSYEMPSDIYVKRRLAKWEPETTQTRLARAHAWADRANHRIYKGFTPMNAVTRNASRGSLYSKVYDRVEGDLLARGYGEARAASIAAYRSAFITKDLMYDISGRSSLDRRLQEYFWFEPVWREQLSVYLSKMPTRAFWLPGIALEYSMAHTIVQGLKSAGLIKDREVADGVTLPYLQTPWGEVSIGGMNPLTPGTEGVLPTLSPGAEAILDGTAQHVPQEYRHYFDTMSQLFTFDQDTSGTPWLPYNVAETVALPMSIAQLFGVDLGLADARLGVFSENYRKTEVLSRQWAMSELAADGIFPPTDSSDAGFEADMRAFEAKIEQKARYYTPGITALQVLTGAFLVGNVRNTGVNPAGQALMEHMTAVGQNGTPFGTDAYWAAQDDYIAEHPEAWPYAIGKKRGDDDPARANDTLNPDDFVDRAITNYGYYFDPQAIKDDALAAAEAKAGANPKNLDPTLSNEAYNAASPKKQQRLRTAWTFENPEDLTVVQADVVGLPQFNERGLLLNTIKHINDTYDNLINSDQSEERQRFLTQQRRREIEQAAAQYGDDGQAVLSYISATPAQRLNRTGYFHGSDGTNLIVASEQLRRDVLDEFPDASMAGAAESYGTLQKKANLFARVDIMRKQDPAFDRQMRYIEFGLGEKDGALGRIAAYQYIFFGERFYDSSLAADVLKEQSK